MVKLIPNPCYLKAKKAVFLFLSGAFLLFLFCSQRSVGEVQPWTRIQAVPSSQQARILGKGSGCIWVEAYGEASVENITPEEARYLALLRSRSNALSALGVHVRVQTWDIQIAGSQSLELFGLYGATLRSGLFLDEKAEFEPKIQGKSVSYVARIKSCVSVIQEIERDPYFRVNAKLSRHNFKDGEKARIKISCSRDCYFYIFNILYDGTVSMIFPASFIREGETFDFPPAGMELEMTTEKKEKVIEAFLVIATKKRFHFDLKGREDFGKFQKLLLRIPPDEWTDSMLPYEVIKWEK